MNNKALFTSTLTGTIVYFLLGWLFYGILFKDLYPSNAGESMLFIFLGCLFYALVFSLIYSRWAGVSTFKSGAVIGFILGTLYAISMSFFMVSSSGTLDTERFITEILIGMVTTGLMGGVIAWTIGKAK